MVFQDLSSSHVNLENQKKSNIGSMQFHIPSPHDRLLAFMIDVLLFSPVAGLLSAIFLRDLRTYVLDGQPSPEVIMAAILFVLIFIVSFSLLQTIFLAFWSSTPGQKIFCMELISWDGQQQDKVSVIQSLLRSFSFWVQALFLFIPTLEILSHSLRRTYYDRVSETLLISLKNSDHRPQKNEIKFLKSWNQIFVLFFVLISLTAINIFQKMTLEATWSFLEAQQKGQVCTEVGDHYKDYDSRLDEAMSLYLLEQVDASCVEREAEFVLWQKQNKYKPMAYLAKALISEDSSVQQEYEKFICNRQDLCQIVKFLKSDSPDRLSELRKMGLQLKSSRVLAMQETLLNQDFASSLALLKDLMTDHQLEPALSKTLVQLTWAQKEEALETEALTGLERKPASLTNPKDAATVERDFSVNDKNVESEKSKKQRSKRGQSVYGETLELFNNKFEVE